MKVKSILWMFIIGMMISSCGGSSGLNEEVDLEMIPVNNGNNWQYIDSKGNVKLELADNLVEGGFFSNGLALVKEWKEDEFMYGYINTKGKVVIESQYKNALPFSNGLAWVTKPNGYPEAINTKGKTVFTLEGASRAYMFKEDLAAFEMHNENGDALYGVVNKKGKVILEPQSYKLEKFSEGKAIIKDDNYKYGYMDKKGNVVINCQFDEVFDFKNGVACVKFGDNWGIINDKGTYTINPRFDNLHPDNKDKFICVENHKVGWIDKEGNYLINPQFDRSYFFFSNKLAPVYNNGKWGYVNEKGLVEIPYQFDEAMPFINEYGIVKLNDQYGLIDKKGKYISNPQYKSLNGDFLDAVYNYYSDYINSDYLNITGITSQLKNIISDTKISDLPYTSNYGELISKFALTENTFPKKNASTSIKTGYLSDGIPYKLLAEGMPWNRKSSGYWNYSYSFNNNAKPKSYSVEIEIPWRFEHKMSDLSCEIFAALMGIPSYADQKLEAGQKLYDYNNFIGVTIFYNNKRKIFIKIDPTEQSTDGLNPY